TPPSEAPSCRQTGPHLLRRLDRGWRPPRRDLHASPRPPIRSALRRRAPPPEPKPLHKFPASIVQTFVSLLYIFRGSAPNPGSGRYCGWPAATAPSAIAPFGAGDNPIDSLLRLAR